MFSESRQSLSAINFRTGQDKLVINPIFGFLEGDPKHTMQARLSRIIS